jgi:hypothetical protein
VVLKMLEGHVDILTPLAKKEEALFRNTTCPVCSGSDHDAVVDRNRPFSKGMPLPNKVLRCRGCSSEFDPYSGIVTKAAVTIESD